MDSVNKIDERSALKRLACFGHQMLINSVTYYIYISSILAIPIPNSSVYTCIYLHLPASTLEHADSCYILSNHLINSIA